MTSDGSRQQPANSNLVILSAGGTGGHMFPAFALARELQTRGVSVALMTDARGEKYRDQYPDIPFYTLRAETMRPGIVSKIRLVVDLVIGTGQAFMLLRKLKPKAVVGFGGYPSFPGVIAAQAQSIPTVIHEQNAVLGKANQVLGASAKRIALSLPELAAIPHGWRSRVVVTGNPVRADIAAIADYKKPDDVFNILVLGGSQGATVFSSVVPEAIGLLPEELRKKISIVQQCRAADIGMAKHAYDVMNVNARLETFIRDVPEQLSKCHLLIARSGASTVTEAAVAGRPAVFVPYPHHKDHQQLRNANVLVKAGAAEVMDEKTMNAADLAKTLERLISDPERLVSMAAAAKQTLAADAAKRLADVVIGL